ncbi:hypothetical protein [Nonomuraea sp. CA-141351]|uniref:hypothetical protein n=1 Tax=Nonomuraea sp. CA-141351 TaxID=3239996 RepID=UPI003D8EEE00
MRPARSRRSFGGYATALRQQGRNLVTFLFALILTTAEEVRPVALGLYTYIRTYVNDWSSVMATAVLASIQTVVPACCVHDGRRVKWKGTT